MDVKYLVLNVRFPRMHGADSRELVVAPKRVFIFDDEIWVTHHFFGHSLTPVEFEAKRAEIIVSLVKAPVSVANAMKESAFYGVYGFDLIREANEDEKNAFIQHAKSSYHYKGSLFVKSDDDTWERKHGRNAD